MKGHKWFAAIYDRMSAPNERKVTGPIREELLKDVTGDVLEIGAGTGANFEYYRNGARITAIEPDPYMLERARARAAEASVEIDLQQAPAEALPFSDATFDIAVSTLVLCSVADPRQALAEIRRVLRPGGEIRLYEHVRYENPVGALVQHAISPVWGWFGAGCHPNRPTGRYLSEAGFEITDKSIRKDLPPLPPTVFVRPHLLARARKPA
jgi:ubiquinone/menaquinone biosynthesis C-methylase UbiE